MRNATQKGRLHYLHDILPFIDFRLSKPLVLDLMIPFPAKYLSRTHKRRSVYPHFDFPKSLSLLFSDIPRIYSKEVRP